MDYQNFTPNQKVLAASIVKKVECSGCNYDEIIEVLAAITGTLVAYIAPTKEELAEFLDKELLPAIRSVALDNFDIQHLKDWSHEKGSVQKN